MDPATATAIVSSIKALSDVVVQWQRMAAIAHEQGDITDEQMADIDARARVSDKNFDDRMADVKRRLGK